MTEKRTERRYRIARIDEIEPTRCPCGWARRAFADEPEGPASFHIVDIDADARTHYHKRHTEIYHVLEGEGEVELDGRRIAISPGSTVLIKPGCRHRAIGRLKIINMVTPAFDPGDEWFD